VPNKNTRTEKKNLSRKKKVKLEKNILRRKKITAPQKNRCQPFNVLHATTPIMAVAYQRGGKSPLFPMEIPASIELAIPLPPHSLLVKVRKIRVQPVR